MNKNLPYILIAFGVAGLVAILSLFDIYDNFENSLLDMRFKSRGIMETRDDIATADIDVRALVQGDDEITYLAENLNSYLDTLSKENKRPEDA